MSEKCYYGYCRPKVPNYPWSLEKIPIGRTILTTSKTAEVKHKKSIPFDIKVTDSIGITLNADGTFALPLGRYLIETQTTASLSIAGSVSLAIGDKFVSNYLQPETPLTMTSMFVVEVANSEEATGVFNMNKEPIKLADNILVITKL